MTERINFKLTYNRATYKFASFLREYLLDAVLKKVDSIVQEESYALFWKDDDSFVVLDTLVDLNTAIDFAKATKTTDFPCVHLSVTINSTGSASEDKKQEGEDSVTSEYAAAGTDEYLTASDAATPSANALQREQSTGAAAPTRGSSVAESESVASPPINECHPPKHEPSGGLSRDTRQPKPTSNVMLERPNDGLPMQSSMNDFLLPTPQQTPSMQPNNSKTTPQQQVPFGRLEVQHLQNNLPFDHLFNVNNHHQMFQSAQFNSPNGSPMPSLSSSEYMKQPTQRQSSEQPVHPNPYPFPIITLLPPYPTTTGQMDPKGMMQDRLEKISQPKFMQSPKPMQETFMNKQPMQKMMQNPSQPSHSFLQPPQFMDLPFPYHQYSAKMEQQGMMQASKQLPYIPYIDQSKPSFMSSQPTAHDIQYSATTKQPAVQQSQPPYFPSQPTQQFNNPTYQHPTANPMGMMQPPMHQTHSQSSFAPAFQPTLPSNTHQQPTPFPNQNGMNTTGQMQENMHPMKEGQPMQHPFVQPVLPMQQMPTPVHQTAATTSPSAPTNLVPTLSAKRIDSPEMALEMKDLKAKVEELERFIKEEIASFHTKIHALEVVSNERNEEANKKFDDLKENLVEDLVDLQNRLTDVEKELEDDIDII